MDELIGSSRPVRQDDVLEDMREAQSHKNAGILDREVSYIEGVL